MASIVVGYQVVGVQGASRSLGTQCEEDTLAMYGLGFGDLGFRVRGRWFRVWDLVRRAEK